MSDRLVPPAPPARGGPPPLPPPLPGQPLNYSPPGPRGLDPAMLIAPALWLTAGAAAFTAAAVWVVPKFASIFMDFRIDLPWPTRLLLAIDSAIVATYLWLLVWLLPLLAPLLVLNVPPDLARDRARRVAKWTVLGILFLGALLAFTLGVPMISLIQGASSSSPKR